MANGGLMQVLLLTRDPWLVNTFTDVSRELGIEAQASEGAGGFSSEVVRNKYEAFLVDFDTVSDTRPILASVRKSPSNKNAVVFAVATDAAQKQEALHEGANFVFERPFVTQEIRRALYAAYERMLGERRRYFRCALELPVLIIRSSSGLSLECVTMNVSSSGMAVKTATQLSQGEAVYISFVPPDKFTVRATGVVIWDDKHGKSGISLQCSGPEMQHRLASWLDSQLAAQENLP